MTSAVGEHGYHGVRVADVVWLAGVSRKTFYELFGGKDDCFAEAYAAGMEHLLDVAFAAFGDRGEWVVRLRAGLAALLSELARDPAVARLCLAEAIAVGGQTAVRRDAALHRLGELFDPPDGPDDEIATTLREGRVSELTETLRREIAAGRTSRLPGRVPHLVAAMVAPYRGIDAARRELERQRRRPAS